MSGSADNTGRSELAATRDGSDALAYALAVVLGHAGFIHEGRFSPGPNTVRLANDVQRLLAEQGWAIQATNGRTEST